MGAINSLTSLRFGRRLRIKVLNTAQLQSMSEEENFNSIEPDQTQFETRNYVEDWFDKHPEPWNIDCHWFNDLEFLNIQNIYVYFADMVHDTWLIKIVCENARRSLYLEKLLYKTTCQMGITLLRSNRELFLLKDLRF